MSSRTRTRERRKQREQERRRNRQVLAVAAVVVVAVIAILLVLLSNQPAEAPIPEESNSYADIPQSTNTDGFPVLGNPDAPVQVVEYSSFDCPHCAEFHEFVTPTLVDRAKAGDISFTYVPIYGTGGIPNGQGAARAALCAGEQGKFWAYHSALFSWQSLYGNTALGGNRLESGASNLGLDMGAWHACIQSAEVNDVLTTARNAMTAQAVQGTPTLFVNGQMVENATTVSDVNDAIDAALAGS